MKEKAGYTLSHADQVQILRKLLLYWDGQWFLKTADTFGLDAAVDLNARVRASFGRIEMRTLLKAVGKRRADDLADAMDLLATYGALFMGGALRAEFAVVCPHRAEVKVSRCAAYEGARLADLPRTDQACVACETLWAVWLETLLPGSGVQASLPMRQGQGDPYCQILIESPAQS
jgi:hypothetical protein